MTLKNKTQQTVSRLALAIALCVGSTSFADSRQTGYTYNELDQVTSVDGPRTDVNDITTYDYDLATANLLSVTNAADHKTLYSNYTNGGLAQTITTPNGAVINVKYDWQGKVLQQEVVTNLGTQTTVYGYDKNGQLISVQSPNGSTLNYEYDPAQRLIAMSNSDGERIDYTLDSAGNITAQTIKDSGANIVRQHSQVFDDLSRLRQHIGGTDSQTTQLGYDADSRNTSVTDPKKNPATKNTYDALNRLTKIIDSADGETLMTYNAQGLIETVKDPRGLITTYGYNGYGELEKITSPDTGTTSFTHDDAGNVTSRTNANGTIINYRYDALNRLTEQRYPADPTKNVLFTYDDTSTGINGTPNKGLGQLTRMTYYGGQIDYQYDQLGRLIAEQRSFGGQTYVTQYGFNALGQFTELTYPSGRLVHYHYDSQGRLTNLTTQESSDAIAHTIVDDLTYLPFGPAKGFSYGNDITQQYRYDLDYRLTELVSNVQDWVYRYDLNSNIESITNNTDITKNQDYGYDELNRLTSANGPYGQYTYNYDEVGNRTQRQKVVGSSTTTEDLTYKSNANQLEELNTKNSTSGSDIVETDSRLFTYSNSGQLKTDINSERTLDFTYNQDDRLTNVDIYKADTQQASYAYNPLGQRISKTYGGKTQHIHYNAQGQRIAESDHNGNVIREYIYLGQQAIAMVVAATEQSNNQESNQDNNPGVISPARIEAEKFTAAYDTTPGNTGDEVCNTGDTDSQTTGDIDGVCNLGWTAAGEWTEYPITVSKTGEYQINVRSAASYGTRTLSLTIDGQAFDVAQTVPTKGWQKYNDILFQGNISAGEHTVRLNFNTGKVNVNYLSFATVEASTPTEVTATQTAEKTNALYFTHNDHLGTPKLLTDISGNVVWQIHTTPFGEVHETITSGIENLTAFPGQYRDSETGLSYNYFRDYDPSIGRYIQSDPIGLNGGLNTYGYVGGNPIGYSDSLGLCYWDACIGEAVTVAEGLAWGVATYAAYQAGQEALSNANEAPQSSSILPTTNSGLPTAEEILSGAIPIPASIMSASNASAECERQCDLAWDRNKFMCDAAGAMHGFKSKAYKTCRDRVDSIYVECIQNCAKEEDCR